MRPRLVALLLTAALTRGPDGNFWLIEYFVRETGWIAVFYPIPEFPSTASIQEEDPRPPIETVLRDRRPRVVISRPLPGTVTQTVTGTTRALTPTSCSSDSHDFSVAEDGFVTVTLLESTGNLTLGVQVCAGGIDNTDCTITLQRIAINQTVSGTRRGGRSQNLKFLPPNCGGGGPVPPGPVQYTAIVNYVN